MTTHLSSFWRKRANRFILSRFSQKCSKFLFSFWDFIYSYLSNALILLFSLLFPKIKTDPQNRFFLPTFKVCFCFYSLFGGNAFCPLVGYLALPWNISVTQKMIFAFKLSKNANSLSLLQAQFESPFATHPTCYNLFTNHFESPPANLIPAYPFIFWC